MEVVAQTHPSAEFTLQRGFHMYLIKSTLVIYISPEVRLYQFIFRYSHGKNMGCVLYIVSYMYMQFFRLYVICFIDIKMFYGL